MRTWLLSGAALAAIATSTAFAADLPARPVYKAAPPPPIVVYSWTGCYVGGNGGGVWLTKDYTVSGATGTSTRVAGTNLGSHDASSWLGGFQVGCNYQFAGGWVVGIQADYDWANAGGSHAELGGLANTDVSRTTSLGSVTGRLGYAWDRFLGYVKGGWAWERDGYLTYASATGLGVAVASETRNGWTIGVGGEYAFTDFLTAFLEYDFYDFGTRTNSFVTGTGANYYNIDIRERKSVVKAGINFKFGGWGPGYATY